MLHRRQLLLGASMFALAGCQSAVVTPPVTPPGPGVPPEIVDDVNAIIGALSSLIPSFGAFLSPDVMAKIQSYLGTAASIAQQIVGAAAGNAGSVISLIQSFAGAVQQVLALLNVNLPANVQLIVSAIVDLLPVILAFAGVRTARAAAPGRITAARATLRAAASQRVR